MKKKLQYTFFISSLMIYCGFAQHKSMQEPMLQTSEQETYQQRYGLRLGADLSKIVRSFLDKDYQGLEFTADYRWNYRFYLAGEIGKEKKTTHTDYFDFTTNGQYIKFGIDYNTYENWRGMENMIFVGGRYAFALFDQKVDSYTIHNLRNQYWQEDIQGRDRSILTNYSNRTAHWLELVIGMKVELLKNLYAGASIRFSTLLYHKNDDFPNFWIPGVQRVWENTSIGVNYNYTLTYLIPLYKK